MAGSVDRSWTSGVGPIAVLAFAVSTHVAGRNGIKPGVAIAVSLLAEAIHLMVA